MGVETQVASTESETATPGGVYIPAEGRPGAHVQAGGGDEARLLANELADKGFLLTSTAHAINWARTGSLHWMTFGLACCAVEMMHTSMPRYDLERFGTAPRASPAAVRPDDRGGDADQQDGAGLAQGLRPDAGAALRDLDGVLRQRRRLLSFQLLGGARLRPHRAGRRLRPGCPPTAEALLYGILQLQRKIRRTGTIVR